MSQPVAASDDAAAPAPAGAGHALCLINRHARSGDVDREALAETLATAGLDCTIRTAAKKGGLGELLRAEGAGYDLVIVGGGDGTVHGLLPDLLALGKPVGLLPLGTANDLAASLGIPTDPAEAAAVIAAGHARRIDVARVTTAGGDECWLVNVASVGFGTNVARAHDGPRKQLLGVLAYPLSWFDAYRRTRPFRIRLTVDGRTVAARAVQVAIGSGTRYGGGLLLSDKARHDDGLLWIYWVKPIRLLGWLAMIPALVTGRHRESRRSEALSGRAVTLETGRPLAINVDGEVDGTTPAEFAVHPGALAVFAPPPG